MGNLQVIEEEGSSLAGKFLVGDSETMGYRGVFLTNASVKILKVIKPRLPS